MIDTNKVLKEFIETTEDEKYKYLINKGRTLPAMDDSTKKDKYKISGCQSEVWVFPEFKEGKLFFKMDAEAVIIKGIVVLLSEIYSNHTPSEVLSLDDDFLIESGLVANLSMTRSNGIAQVVKQVKMYALVYNAMNK
jgi:cysteine desulfuration protein SufE